MSGKVFLGLLTVAFLVSGCDSMRHTFGLDRYRADEMAVDPNPPLTIPPNSKLRPPRPGAANPNQRNHTNEAAAVLTSESQGSAKATGTHITEDHVLNQAAAQGIAP